MDEDEQPEDDQGDVYSDGSRSEMVEDDEMSPEEEGFMEGFEKDSKKVRCAYCKKIIIDPDDAIEKEQEGEVFLFCSEECYQAFKKEEAEK